MTDATFMVFSGNANVPLAKGIVRALNMRRGHATLGRFSDAEISYEIEENVRGRDVFIVQPTCSPVNENLMELLVMIDAFRRSSAALVTAVIPYYGYSRQDRRIRSARVPIAAKLVAKMIWCGLGRWPSGLMKPTSPLLTSVARGPMRRRS